MLSLMQDWFNCVAKTFTYLFAFIFIVYLVLVGFNDLYIPFSYLVPFWTLYERIGIVFTGIVSLIQIICSVFYIKSISNKNYIFIAMVATIFWFFYISFMIVIAHLH
jgi:hypothetical protein